MDGTICLPRMAEPLEIHGQSQSARPHDAANHHAPKPPAQSSAYEAWLHQPARTKIRRPLSPICPLIIGERPPAPSLWRRQEVTRFVPLAGSIALHVVIIILGLMTFRTERPRIRGGIPIAGTITAAEARSTTENVTPQIATVAKEMFAEAPKIDQVFPMPHEPSASTEPDDTEDLPSTAMLPPAESDEKALLLGVGPQAIAALPVKREAAEGSTAGTQSDAPAKLAGGANEAKFFGVQGTGQAVVYVCDASGSMMGTNDVIVNQLQRALLAMHSTQVFNVIFFSGRSVPVVFDARDMIPADANNKLAACGFAKRYSCGGNSKGLPAIRSALQRNPDLMYLVTDGDFDDSDAIIDTIRSMNHDGFTKINVILVSGARQDPSGYRFLKQIADENGGTCRMVNPNSF